MPCHLPVDGHARPRLHRKAELYAGCEQFASCWHSRLRWRGCTGGPVSAGVAGCRCVPAGDGGGTLRVGHVVALTARHPAVYGTPVRRGSLRGRGACSAGGSCRGWPAPELAGMPRLPPSGCAGAAGLRGRGGCTGTEAGVVRCGNTVGRVSSASTWTAFGGAGYRGRGRRTAARATGGGLPVPVGRAAARSARAPAGRTALCSFLPAGLASRQLAVDPLRQVRFVEACRSGRPAWQARQSVWVAAAASRWRRCHQRAIGAGTGVRHCSITSRMARAAKLRVSAWRWSARRWGWYRGPGADQCWAGVHLGVSPVKAGNAASRDFGRGHRCPRASIVVGRSRSS